MGLRSEKNLQVWVEEREKYGLFFLISGRHNPITFLDKYPSWFPFDGLVNYSLDTLSINPYHTLSALVSCLSIFWSFV